MQNELLSIRERLHDIADQVALLEGIVAYSPLAIHIFKSNGQSQLTNRACDLLFGAQPPPGYNIFQDEILARLGLLDRVRRAFAGETVSMPPVWYDPRDLRHVHLETGNRILVESLFFPLFNREKALSNVACVYRDVTEEWKARQETESERDLLRLIIDQSGDGIVVADEKGVVRIFNAEAERQNSGPMPQVAPIEWQNRYKLFRLDGTPLPLEEIPLYRALHGERVKQAQFSTRDSHGQEITLSATATPVVKQDGTQVGAVVITRDETEKRKAQADLVKANEDLKRAVSVRDDFLSIASHELRTPLTALHLQIQILDRLVKAAGDDPRWQELSNRVEGAHKSLNRMNNLVSNLLDISRISSGGLKLTLGETNLSEVVRGVVSLFQDQLEAAGCRLELAVAPHVIGQWDATRLDQVVSNLLSNAIKYGRGKPIHISLEKTGGEARLAVRDEGIGIDARLQEKIFDRFERAVSERSYGGFGLGLWIVRQIVESHGGTVRVDSDARQGATFTVTLPGAS